MRRSYLLATLVALCAIAHASTLPVFTTKFMLPENSETLPELTEKVAAYIEDLVIQRSGTVSVGTTMNRLVAPVSNTGTLSPSILQRMREERNQSPCVS